MLFRANISPSTVHLSSILEFSEMPQSGEQGDDEERVDGKTQQAAEPQHQSFPHSAALRDNENAAEKADNDSQRYTNPPYADQRIQKDVVLTVCA